MSGLIIACGVPEAVEKNDGFTVVGSLSASTTVNVEPVGKWYGILSKRRKHNLSLSVCEEDSTVEEVEDEDQDDATNDGSAYTTIDAGDWKNQDHYALLGLQNLRWQATNDDIKKAYKKSVLKYHPDKKKDSSAAEEASKAVTNENDHFTCIQKAYELLLDPAKRRLYDSVDDPDDSVPSITKDEKTFFENFGPAFERNSKWLEERPVPQLGGPDLPYEKVAEFYDFWYNAKSWREFGYFDEEDPDQAESREEKRWIIRMNKAARKKKKKEEGSRMAKLIDNAFASDPRVKKHRKQEKERKAALKRQKAEERRAEEQAIIDAQKKAEEERIAKELAAKQADKKSNELAKKARRAFAKACKRSKINEGKEYAFTVEIDELKGSLTVERLQEIVKLPAEEFIPAVYEELEDMREAKQAKADKAAKANRKWTAEEQAALEEAMRTVSKDAPDRWKQIAAQVPGRTRRDCVNRIKELSTAVKEQKALGPTEWTKEEEVVVIKAASKVYPPGTQGDRWDQIAEYLKTHAHTEWKRSNKDVISKVNSLKNVSAVMDKKKSDEAAETGDTLVNLS